MSGKPQLLYFDITGRGEIIRLLYKHAGVEFEDKRIPFDLEIYERDYKSNVDLVPLGFVPVLTTPCGKKISQTTAIMRYVAGELNLFGKCNVQRAVIDSTIVCNKEIGDGFVEIKYCKCDKKKEELKEKWKKTVDKYFAYYERLIKESGGPFINGSEICVADIFFYSVTGFITFVLPTWTTALVLEKFPLLQNVFNKVEDSENIKKYLESQK